MTEIRWSISFDMKNIDNLFVKGFTLCDITTSYDTETKTWIIHKTHLLRFFSKESVILFTRGVVYIKLITMHSKPNP